MSSDLGQFGNTLDESDDLFPYPKELVDYDFSLNKRFKMNDKRGNTVEVEFRLISPIEFSLSTSSQHQRIKDIFQEEGLKFVNNKSSPQTYEMNVKHYLFVLSNIKHLHSDVYMTINYNHFDINFIKSLMKYQTFNDNILTFIQNSKKNRNSILESMQSDPIYGKSMEKMSDSSMFDDFYSHQKISFYMCVIRNGKSILADKEGKSLTAITVMTYYRKDWPLVVVCDQQRKKYWSNELSESLRNYDPNLRISAVNTVQEIYVYPKPFHDIMIIDYDLYYKIKDTPSYRNLNIKAYIFEDQTRGTNNQNGRQWKGLSQCSDNLKKAQRVIFIWSNGINLDKCRRLWPLINILDPNVFDDFEHFSERYFSEDREEYQRQQLLIEFQILLRSTVLIRGSSD